MEVDFEETVFTRVDSRIDINTRAGLCVSVQKKQQPGCNLQLVHDRKNFGDKWK